jgi:AcrR family transcriptional regulator
VVDGPDLRERRRLSTGREITRVALELVAEHGLGQVTVEDIAKAAGVSPRTFFNYFTSKKSAVIPGPQPLPAEIFRCGTG